MCEVAAACAGRIVSKRTQGKLIFYDLKAEGAKVQIMANSRSGGQTASWLVPLQCGSCSAISLPTCLVAMNDLCCHHARCAEMWLFLGCMFCQ